MRSKQGSQLGPRRGHQVRFAQGPSPKGVQRQVPGHVGLEVVVGIQGEAGAALPGHACGDQADPGIRAAQHPVGRPLHRVAADAGHAVQRSHPDIRCRNLESFDAR